MSSKANKIARNVIIAVGVLVIGFFVVDNIIWGANAPDLGANFDGSSRTTRNDMARGSMQKEAREQLEQLQTELEQDTENTTTESQDEEPTDPAQPTDG
ncbi:MAG: hypothetical protein AAF297_04220 [Planctomycetota bacterium]